MSFPLESFAPPSPIQPGTASNPLRKKHFKPALQPLSLSQSPVQRSQRFAISQFPTYLKVVDPGPNPVGVGVGAGVGSAETANDVTVGNGVVGDAVGADVVE